MVKEVAVAGVPVVSNSGKGFTLSTMDEFGSGVLPSYLGFR
jgi:hypothetical protein